MAINMYEEIADVRERVASIEATLKHVGHTMDKIQNGILCSDRKRRGEIVIPVTVVVAGIEVLKVVIEKFF